MMKWIISTSRLLAYLITICMLAACIAKPTVPTHSTHKVGQAIEGEYNVYLGKDLVLAGHLNLNNGQYVFTLQQSAEQEITPAKSRFFFIEYPKGMYLVEYNGSIKPSSVLNDLKNNDILLTITFDAVDAKNHDSNPFQDADRVFLIRNDKDKTRLYFHSIINEYELWEIEKQWDNLP